MPTRNRKIERWLVELVATYQDSRKRPRLAFDNLVSLASPTQIYAIYARVGNAYLGSFLITHSPDIPNGLARAVRVSSVKDLAEFADLADAELGLGDFEPEFELPGILWPKLGLAAQACVRLARQLESPVSPDPETGFLVAQRELLQTKPNGALWSVAFRRTLPPAVVALATLGQPKPRRVRSANPRRLPPERSSPSAPVAPASSGFGAYPEPLVWFGTPPFPSAADHILKHYFFRDHLERPTWKGNLGGRATLVFRSGLILVCTEDAAVARRLINHVFAVLSRSGVLSYALPTFELISYTGVDPASGATGGSHATITPRNWLLNFNALERHDSLSFCLPEDVVPLVMDTADKCARSSDFDTPATALLNALTLYHRDHQTEAFLTAWALIESVVGRKFEAHLISRGWSKTRVGAMEVEWAASQQIDLLVAVDEFSMELGSQLHRLRKLRNDMIHKLVAASSGQSEEAIHVASDLLQLPAVDPPLAPVRVFL